MTLANRKKVAIDLTGKIESMLDGFGIKVRVNAVSFEKKSILMEMAIASGIRVEEVEGLSKTIAMAVASPTGRVEVIAPIPGKSVVGIRIPMDK